MNWIKKTFRYQYLMLSAFNFSAPDANNNANGKVGCLTLFILFMLPNFFSTIFGGMSSFSFIIISVGMTYIIVSNNKQLYALMPVSKKFALFNIYLLPITTMLMLYIIATIISALFILIFFVFILTSSGEAPGDDAIYSAFDLKSLVFSLMLIVVLILVMTAISVIRKRNKRFISLISFIVLFCASLIWLRSSLPSSSTEDIYIISFNLSDAFTGFGNLPNANIILIGLAIILSIIAPLSIKITYKEYMKEID